MTVGATLPPLIERFFTQRLMQRRNASSHTIASYRDTFRLLFAFTHAKLGKPPSRLDLADLDAPFICTFLDDLEAGRSVGIRTRNLRLTAIRAFFRFVALEKPAYSGQIQRVLAIPGKLHDKREVHFLTRPEIEAILAAPDRSAWIGRRDHMLLHLALQTGLRLSEIVQFDRDAVALGTGAHVRCIGKGRKVRCTPLTRQTCHALQAWLKEADRGGSRKLFPSVHGNGLSPDAVQRLLARHVGAAMAVCPSLRRKRVTPHVLRHTAAMELFQAGVDCSVIALWLGHESHQDDAGLSARTPRVEGGGPSQGQAFRWTKGSATRPATGCSPSSTGYSVTFSRSESSHSRDTASTVSRSVRTAFVIASRSSASIV